MIHLGYETGTGKAVGIPLAHMAVTGQTQQSGKTTTLEALIDRGDLRAVVFITKPGEKSFSEGRRILPFFKERADWEYVKELLESRRNESLSKWDGYLMRVCRRARTLQDVRDNVEGELPKKKSARPSHYEVLAGYLDLIIPELERVPYADKLDLRAGVNIMDLTGMSDEMQSLVLRSTIEQIHKSERNTVLVLPEAWKFIPEGGRSSVFQALHALIREGATNGNFVWIDAQDLAIVSKRILKSVTVWVLGKQQEANEVARTINHLIEPLHILPDMIKSLGIGQFLVCGEGVTKRVYVQPRWLGELDALAIARGEESVETAQAIWRQKVRESKRQKGREYGTQPSQISEPDGIQSRMGPEDIANRAPGELRVQQSVGAARISEKIGNNSEPAQPIAGQEDKKSRNHQAGKNQAEIQNENGADGDVPGGEDEAMWKERWEKLSSELAQTVGGGQDDAAIIQNVKTLRDAHDALALRIRKLEGAKLPPVNKLPANGDATKMNVAVPSIDLIYAQVIERAQNDPGILQLLASRPELRVEIERPVLKVDGKTLRGGLVLLIHDGFFGTAKSGNAAWKEVLRCGRKVASKNVYRELDNLAELGFLTKEPDGYQATDLKVSLAKDSR